MFVGTSRFLQNKNACTEHQLITLIALFFEELLLTFCTRKSEANYTVSRKRRADWENNDQR